MPFSLDINDKNADKPKLSLAKKHPALFPLFIFILLVVGYYLVVGGSASPKIGVVPIDGVIMESETILRKIRLLEEDPLVKGVVVRINSPGGAVSPSQEIFESLASLSKKKKVYASISSMAASGGYYIAVGTEKIFANPGSLVGSIGTIIRGLNLEKLMSKLGVRMEVITSGEYKGMGSMFRSISPDERILLKATLKDVHRQFMSAVADNRPLTLKEVEPLADGRVFTGKQALDLKLVDSLGGLNRAVEQMRRDLKLHKKPELFYPPEKSQSWRALLGLESLLSVKKDFFHSGLFYLNR